MTLKTLKLTNFRSYPEQEFAFEGGINVISGPNGSGKTNLLEAVYMLGVARSFRAAPAAIIHTDQEWFRIAAQTNQREALTLTWENRHKRTFQDQQEVRVHDFIGALPVVLFEPGSLDMIYGSPARRRQLLDRILCVSDKGYLQALLQLRRILKQRNALLRHSQKGYDEIFGWDVLLVEQAAYIYKQRQQLIEHLNGYLPDVYKRVSETNDSLSMEYQARPGSEGDYTQKLLEQLQSSYDKDRLYGSTSVGPHRDEVAFFYNGQQLAAVGSRGEVRTAVLALLLAEYRYMCERFTTPPVVLLDDVFSELDPRRQAALLDNLDDTQVLITTTDIPTQLPGSYHHLQLPT